MRRFAVGLALLAVASLASWVWLGRSPRTPSSLLLVTIDTLRADRVGAYGSAGGLTPSLDRLAASGWVFEHAVSAVPLTLPSHSTILSGLDPLHHGVRNNGTYVFPPSRETLATRLKASGYATAAFVSAVVLDRRYGLARGFDVYDDRIARAGEGRSVLESERPCGTVVSNATAWIGARTGPFFAWVHIYEPHAPYAPPEDMAKAHPGQLYDAEVATADRCLGKLIEAAQAARPDRLVTAVTSDHGEGLGDHGESTHGLFVYQSTLDVPMVIAGAGVPRGKRTGALARSVDLAPTLLALLGAPGLTGVDGKNLAKGGGAGEAYAETDYPTGFGWAPLRSWRLGDLKLIEAPEVELYDLARDPKEERNLALTRATETARLRAVLKSALAGEVQKDQRRLNSEGEERLRSLGYVAGAAPTPGESTSALDPKAALPLFRDFERAMESEARGDLTTSALLLRALTRSDPGNVAFQRSLGSVLRRSGRAGESARLLTEAQRLTPKDAAIAHDRAMALQEMGRSEQAIEAEERATMLDPGFADAFEHLATLYALRGDFARARDAVDRAIALDGNSAWAWSNRGNIARAQKQTDEAGRSYRRAVELSPDVVDAVNGLGVLAVERGDLEEAARRFSRALELAPGLDEARLNLAVVESQRGHLERAVALATETAKAARDPALKAKAGAFLRDLGRSGR